MVKERELYIGNICEELDAQQRNRYKWTMFLSASKERLVPPRTVKKVTYSLHPTFRQSECPKRKSPFFLPRRGWGTFDVDAKIEFKTKYRRKFIRVSHMLDFDNRCPLPLSRPMLVMKRRAKVY